MTDRAWLEQLTDATARLRDEGSPRLRSFGTGVEDLHAHLVAEVARARREHPRLLVLLCGTTLMPPGALERTRTERVAAARSGADPDFEEDSAYVATEGAVERLCDWRRQGAEITYVSVNRDASRVAASSAALRARGFPAGEVLSRGEGETYADVVARAAPDVLIEDDRTSSGRHEIAYNQLRPDARARIRSVIVPEFGGLEHLPASLQALLGPVG